MLINSIWSKLKVIRRNDTKGDTLVLAFKRRVVFPVYMPVEALGYPVFMHYVYQLTANECSENGRKVEKHQLSFSVTERLSAFEDALKSTRLTSDYFIVISIFGCVLFVVIPAAAPTEDHVLDLVGIVI